MKNIIYKGRTYQNHKLRQLIEDFREYLKENPDVPPFFKGRVENNPRNQDGEQEIWFMVDKDGCLSSIFPNQCNIGGVDYAWNSEWTEGEYKGSITVIELPVSRNSKPEVYKVGDRIQVMESVRGACGDSLELAEKLVGKIFHVSKVYDEMRGLYYLIRDTESTKNWYVPHYAVKKVLPEEKITITLTSKEYQQIQEILKQVKENKWIVE